MDTQNEDSIKKDDATEEKALDLDSAHEDDVPGLIAEHPHTKNGHHPGKGGTAVALEKPPMEREEGVVEYSVKPVQGAPAQTKDELPPEVEVLQPPKYDPTKAKGGTHRKHIE